MLDTSLLVLVLQIGFNTALNYRGYNKNPLIQSSGLINYGQSRRVLNSNRYEPLPSRRFLTSDSAQSDSEDSSLEETNLRSLRPPQRLPYQKRNNYLKYNTRTDNDMSLETAPVGRIGSDNYANTYSSALTSTNREDTNFRRPYLRQRLPNLRLGQTRKYHRKGDNDLSLEVLYFDDNSPGDSLAAARGEDASYLRSLLSLIELPNLRRDQRRKYHRKGDNDLSLEVSPVDRLDPDENVIYSMPASRAASLGDTRRFDSLSSSIETPNYRRAGVNLEKTLSDRFILDDDNSNSQRPLQSILESPNYRRDNYKHSGITKHDYRFLMPYPIKNTPDAYTDTVLLGSAEGKPDDIAIARPQLRNSQVTNLSKNNKIYNRRSGDGSSLELSSNDRLSSNDDTSSYLSALHRLKTRLRSRKLTNSNPNVSKTYYRNNDDNVSLESLSNDRLNPNDDDADNLSVLHLSSLEDVSLEKSILRNRNKKQENRRQDKGYLRLSVSSNDRPSPDKDVADNLSVLSLASLGDLNPTSTQLRNRVRKQQINRQDNHRNYLRLALSPNNKLSLDEDVASSLSDLLPDNLDGLNLVPASLRLSELSNQKNSRIDHGDAKLELLLNDRLSAEEDELSNLPVLNSRNFDDLSANSPLLRNREPTNRSYNKNQRSSRRNNKNEALELLLTERLDDNAAEDLVPYHESRSDEHSNNSGNEKVDNNRRDNNLFNLETLFNDSKDKDDDLGLALSSNDKLNLEDNAASDLSVLHVTSPDNLSLESLRLGSTLKENQTTQQDTTDTLHLEFPWNTELSPDDKESSNVLVQHGIKTRLRSRENIDPKDYELKLEYPWTNDKLSPDDKESSNFSARRGPKSQLRSRENIDPKDYELNLEYPWTYDKLSPDDKESSIFSSRRGPKSQLRSRENIDPKDYELKLDYPWTNDKLSPDEDTTSEKPAYRTSNVVDPLYEHPYLRNRKRNNMYYHKRSYEDASLENSQLGLKSYLRNSDSSLNENKSLLVMPIARQRLENGSDTLKNSDEVPSRFITLPLDRRPYLRHRTRGKADRPLHYNRRGITVLTTTTVSPSAEGSSLNTSENIEDVKTFNDTIIFPTH